MPKPPGDDAPSSTGCVAGACARRGAGAVGGSQSSWLEDRGPKLTLLIAVGDATGTEAQAAFHTTEDSREYLMLLEALVRCRGSSRATTPPFLDCRLEITAKGVVQWRMTGRRPCPHCGKPH